MQGVDIPGFPGYQVTETGQVTSLRGRSPRVLKPHFATYARVSLRRDGKTFTRTVHALVALAYIGPPPPGREVRHLDGDPFNNRVDNLRYSTHQENQLDQIRHGTHAEARKTHCAQGHSYAEHGMPPMSCRPTARRCRICHRIWNARCRAKKAATANHND